MEREAEDDVNEANVMLVQARIALNKVDDSVNMRYPDEPDERDDSDGDCEIGAILPTSISPMRKRTCTSSSGSERMWAKVNNIVIESTLKPGSRALGRARSMKTGKWEMPLLASLKRRLFRRGEEIVRKNAKIFKHAASESGIMVKNAVEDHTYAVVTFTSRQAALAARQCLADGSGLDRWKEVEDIPIPPLADAAPYNLFSGRGCCRPVTLTLNDNEMSFRRNM